MKYPTLFPEKKRGLLFILSGPAGVGKTTLMRMLTEEFPNVQANVSCTTRSARVNEVYGIDYIFLDEDTFSTKVAQNEFLEYACVYGNYYGSCHKMIEEKLNQGVHIFLVIDVQGAKTVMNKTDTVSIFINPPSIEDLRDRLLARATESGQSIHLRMQKAQEELLAADFYDYQIVNDNLSICYQVLRSIVIAESYKTITLQLNAVQDQLSMIYS